MLDYDPHDWRSHLFDVKGSMVREIFFRVLSCVLWSVAVVCFHKFVHPVALFQDGHVLIGVALGMLLVFRTNASYDRFWEGRKQWGAIINETRNLGRGVTVLLAADPELVRRILAWTSAFAWASMNQLRGTGDLGPFAANLDADEVATVQKAQHPPLAIACRISRLLDEARRRGLISDYQFVYLDNNVQVFVDYLGACERIHKTPLPFAYVVHLRRALILYCFTLPFALLDHFGWGTIAATLVLSYTLFGIEEIGVEIEDPFGADDNDLPLQRFCTTIDNNLQGLLPLTPHPSAPVGEGKG